MITLGATYVVRFYGINGGMVRKVIVIAGNRTQAIMWATQDAFEHADPSFLNSIARVECECEI